MSKRRNDALYADAGTPNNNKIIASRAGPHGTFVDYAQNRYKELATGENPELGKKLYNENQQIFYLQFLDSIVRGEIRLEDDVRMWLTDDATWVNELFPVTISESTQITMFRTVIQREMVRIGVHNTPARVISSTTESITFNTSFRQQAFETDYYALKQPGGMEIFNLMMTQLYSNIKGTETYATVSTFQDFVSAFPRPEQRYPFESRPPVDPYSVHRLEQKNLACLNKDGLGIEMLSTKANEILSREFERLRGWVVSPDDMDYMHSSNNAKNVFTFISGSRALTNRSTTKEPMRSEIEFFVIPMLAENIHNGSSEYINTHIISNGSLAIFLNDHTESPAEKYRSAMTDIYMISAPSDVYDRYRFIDCVCKDFRFQAIDRCSSLLYPDRSTRYTGTPAGSQQSMTRMQYIQKHAALPGHINRNLINEFLADPRSIFERHRTADTTLTRETLDILVRHDPTVNNHDTTRQTTGGNTLYPLTFMGELAEQRANIKHMRFCYKTLANRIFQGISEDAYAVFQRGLNWANRMSKGTAQFGDKFIVSQIKNLANATDPAVVYTADTRAARKELRTNADIKAAPASMLKPNKWGGMLSEMSATATDQVPYGYGNISGMYTILDAIQKGNERKFDAETIELIPKFIPVYERIVNNMMNCLPEHICLSPSLVPYIHDSDEMSDIMRVRIVAWYTVFANFVPPSYFITDAITDVTRPARQTLVKDTGLIGKYVTGNTVGDLMTAAAGLNTLDENKQTLKEMSYIIDLASKLCTFASTTTISNAITSYDTDTVAMGKQGSICATQLCFVSESTNKSQLFADSTDASAVELIPAILHTIQDKTFDFANNRYRHEMKLNTMISSSQKTTLHPDRISFSDSLFAAAAYIDPTFPLIGRTTGLLDPVTFRHYRETVYPAWMNETRPKAFDFRNHLFHNNYPLTADSYTQDAIDYAQEYTSVLYNENMYKIFRERHPNVHEGLAHLFFFPVNGNFHNRIPGRIENFDRRWNLTYSYELREGIAARLMCLRDITVQSIFAAYENNICTPLSGTILRRMETQRFKSYVGVSDGAIGVAVKGNYDQLQMFHAGVKTFRTEASINHGAAVTEKEKVVIMEFCRGLEHLGGKGNGWVRDKVSIPAILDKIAREPIIDVMNRNMLNGALLGNDSNIFVLQGISTNIGTNGGTQTLDVCGYWDRRDFVGRLHDCPEFEDKNQKEWMYDGVAFTNFIYEFTKHRNSREILPIDKYSLRNVAQTRLINFHCNMTSMRMHDRSHGIHTVTSRHPLGDQVDGSIAIETSRGRIGYVKH